MTVHILDSVDIYQEIEEKRRELIIELRRNYTAGVL